MSLWRAVKIAKDVEVNSVPKVIYKDDKIIHEKYVPGEFALHFDNK